MYKKRYIYIVSFSKGKEYNRAFADLDKLRQHLVYGFELPFDESKIKDTGQDREIIYSQDNITIERVVLVQ
jgi:hypothetical protein